MQLGTRALKSEEPTGRAENACRFGRISDEPGPNHGRAAAKVSRIEPRPRGALIVSAGRDVTGALLGRVIAHSGPGAFSALRRIPRYERVLARTCAAPLVDVEC